METQKHELNSGLTEKELFGLGGALNQIEGADLEELILDTAMGYKSQATHKDYESYTTEQLENEFHDQKYVLRFLLLLNNLKVKYNGIPGITIKNFKPIN